jgi:glycerol-3-phosphate acyltransferase PlsY
MDINLVFVVVTVLIFILPAIAARNLFLPTVIVASFLVLALPLHFDYTLWTVIFACIALLIVIIILLVKRKSIFRIPTNVELKAWRIVARPFALLFIPIRIYAGERFLLYLVGILALIAISIDLYRLFSRRQISLLFKKTEIHRFSSMTSFLVAVFLIFLLFPPDIAYLCLAFILFGDMAAKFFGLGFGRRRIIRDRTLEGSLGFLTGCLYAGFLIVTLFDIPFSYLMAGALFATVFELFSFTLDDNFTVGILTGGCLAALNYFQVL